VEYDQVVYVNMQVPLCNYAVTLTLPALFTDLFKSYSLSLASGNRTVRIQEAQKAYFNVADGGFTYKLEATNNDNVSHATTPITYRQVESGKLYNMTYYYGTDANSGGIDIEITDNMESEDVPLG
jgi:membrane carboxypeptidase/penicillin-binding protein PbpC